MKGLKCLKCGGKIEFKEWVDEEVDGGSFRQISYGLCEDCGTGHSWVDVYTFSHHEELQIEEE